MFNTTISKNKRKNIEHENHFKFVHRYRILHSLRK